MKTKKTSSFSEIIKQFEVQEIGWSIAFAITPTLILYSFIPQEFFSSEGWAGFVIRAAIFVFLLILITCVVYFFICAYKDRKLIENIEDGVGKLLDKKRIEITSEEAFNFNKRNFGYYFRKREILIHINNNGSAEGRERVCLIMEDRQNVLNYVDFHLSTDELFYKGEEKILSSEKDEKRQVNCEGEKCLCNKNLDECNYKNKQSPIVDIKISSIISSFGSALFRYNFIGGLRAGSICRFNFIEKWPKKSFALFKKDLKEKQKSIPKEFLKDLERKNEFYYFQILMPVEYLKINLCFPSFYHKVKFIEKAALINDSNYKINEETKRIKLYKLQEDEELDCEIVLEVNCPLVGIKYGIEWEPLDKNYNFENMPQQS